MRTNRTNTALSSRSTSRRFTLERTTKTDFDATLRALDREGILVSSADRDSGEIWLGLLHGEEAWCRVGILVAHDHYVVRLRAFAPDEALGYIRWRYADLIDDEVDVGPQHVDGYGLAYCDMERRIRGLYETVDWTRRMLDGALEAGMEFSARFGFDFSPDSFDMAWHFGCAA
jgi:hypothetical protein